MQNVNGTNMSKLQNVNGNKTDRCFLQFVTVKLFVEVFLVVVWHMYFKKTKFQQLVKNKQNPCGSTKLLRDKSVIEV